MNYKLIFLAFLQREGVLQEFIYNTKNHSIVDPRLNVLFEDFLPDNYLWSAFDWYSTKQGHKYWKKLSLKWESFLERVENRKK